MINLAFLPIEEILNKGFKDLVDPFFLLIKSLNEPTSFTELDFAKSNFFDLRP